MRRTLSSLVLATALVSPASAASITVPLDQVRMITFAKPVATVYVGNPTVADVNMIDTRRAFVLGKMYGATNIIALDANGNQVANSQVTVFSRGAGTVTLNKGSTQTTLTCAGRCESTPTPGDAKEVFDSVTTQTQTHQDLNKKSAAIAQ